MVSKMLVEGTNKRIFSIHDNLGMVVYWSSHSTFQVIGGRIPDGKNIVHRARLEAQQYKQNFGIDIIGSVILNLFI